MCVCARVNVSCTTVQKRDMPVLGYCILCILCVCFRTHRDAGEDEGDLDFSALLKATKK